jgi:hypothetical protein
MPRESDSEQIVRECSEQIAQRIDELSRGSGGLGPGDIVQIAQREAEERRDERLAFIHDLD